MPKFNLKLFKTLILNFGYIFPKLRKLGMFILYQECQFTYPNKVNSPPIRQFPLFSIFGHVTCHVTIIKRSGARRPQDLLLEKISFCSRSPSERYSTNIPRAQIGSESIAQGGQRNNCFSTIQLVGQESRE